jgi:nucleotide-binding universal stress UspA family protein
LIVLAPHDKGIDAPLTSLSAWVAAETACPVLIHRSRIGTRAGLVGGFQQPLVAISDQRLTPLALSVARGLAEPGAHFELMHVLENVEVDLLGPPGTTFHQALRDSSEEVGEQLKVLGQGLEQEGFLVSVRVDTGDPVQSVLCRLETTPNDLVVLSRTTFPDGQGQLSDHAYAMVQKSPVPVLIIPPTPAVRARPLRGDLAAPVSTPSRRASS